MERARLLFGCYRRGDANDPDTYVAAIAAVLARYDTDLIRDVTDPRTGIMTTEKFMTFMPNAGELKVYCDGVAARRERIQHLGSLPAPVSRALLPRPEPKPGDLASVHIPAEYHRYPEFLRWSETADPRLWRFGMSSEGRNGIWVAFHVWSDGHSATRSIGELTRDATQQAEDAA